MKDSEGQLWRLLYTHKNTCIYKGCNEEMYVHLRWKRVFYLQGWLGLVRKKPFGQPKKRYLLAFFDGPYLVSRHPVWAYSNIYTQLIYYNGYSIAASIVLGMNTVYLSGVLNVSGIVYAEVEVMGKGNLYITTNR